MFTKLTLMNPTFTNLQIAIMLFVAFGLFHVLTIRLYKRKLAKTNSGVGEYRTMLKTGINR